MRDKPIRLVSAGPLTGVSHVSSFHHLDAHRGRRFALADQQLLPLDGKIKSILNAVVVIAVVVWLLQAFGVLGSLNGIHVS
jgi:hypothetical protein